jgi:hypothetical protein
MDISALCSRLHIHSSAVISLSDEFRRCLQLKTSWNIGNLKNSSDTAKNVCCVELAHKQLMANNKSFDRLAAIKLAGFGSQTTYRQCLAAIENLLQLNQTNSNNNNSSNNNINSMQNSQSIPMKPRVSIRELAIQYGCLHILTQIQSNFEEFQRNYTKSLSPAQLHALQSNSAANSATSKPAYIAANFLLTAKATRVAIDRARLKQQFDIGEKQLQSAIELIRKINSHIFPMKLQTNKKQRVSAEAQEAGIDSEEEFSAQKSASESAPDAESSQTPAKFLECDDLENILAAKSLIGRVTAPRHDISPTSSLSPSPVKAEKVPSKVVLPRSKLRQEQGNSKAQSLRNKRKRKGVNNSDSEDGDDLDYEQEVSGNSSDEAY